MEEDLPPVPSSPAQSVATTALGNISNLNLPLPSAPPLKVLSKSDLEESLQIAEELLQNAKGYRNALAALSTAASAFGSSMEQMARCRGTGVHADGLLASGGLQYLLANHQQVLAETMYREFEVPLLHELDNYRSSMTESSEQFKKAASEKTRNLRKTEKEHMKLAKQKKRNLASFRTALVDLTRQIDELDKLRYDHYAAALELAEDMAGKFLDAAAVTVRAEVEIYEAVARKGWSGGGLEDLLARSADPFHVDSPTIFSILPDQSILPNPQSPLLDTSDKYMAIATALRGNQHKSIDEDDDDNSIFSERRATQSLPPFSPRSRATEGPAINPPPLQLPLAIQDRLDDIGEE